MSKKKCNVNGIYFTGYAANDVTGSQYFVKFEDHSYLLECGLHQSSKNSYLDSYKINSEKFKFNPKNNNWVNNDAKEIFSLARISCKVSERYANLGILGQLSLLEFPKRIDNLSCRVTYIDPRGDDVLFISDFRELGYEYLNYLGGNFSRCAECGKLFRNNKYKNRRYCTNCQGYTHKPEYKTSKCVDCGEIISFPSNVATKIRCECCQRKYTQQRKNKWKAEH